MQNPVPVVRLIVQDDHGRVLILKRRDTTYGEGAWCLPGGKVDYGQTVEEAARQELREETGLECLSLRFLFYQDSLPVAPGAMHGINFYFDCTASGTVVLNEEACEYAWIAPKDLELHNLVFRNNEGLRAYWHQKAEGSRQ
jgi:8-oxo-dGTP pyrophosphatase MutT (NUDIX family)